MRGQINPKAFFTGIGAAFALNLIWENAQAPLYQGHNDFFRFFWMCSVAAVGDVAIVAGLYLALALHYRDWTWYGVFSWSAAILTMAAGASTAVAVEWWALDTGRWRYSDMPIVPVLNIGLLPLLQMLAIPLIVFWLMRVIERSK
jgi:hypothetical protein